MPTFLVFPRLAATALAFALAAPGGAQTGAPSPSPAPPAANRAVTSPGNAEWAASVADARARATTQKKLVFYEFVSKDCGDCRRMQGLLDPAFDFEALLIGMVPVQVALSSPDGKTLGERYNVTEEPSILIATPEGRLVFLMQGFKDAQDFYTHAHRDLDAYRKFAKEVDGQDVATLSAAEAYSTGRALYARFDFEGAISRLQRAASAPDAKPEVRESALMGMAAAQRQLGQYPAARRSAEKVIATTKNGDQKERAELFVAELALAQNRPGEALADYQKFVRDHPKSPYLEKVQGFIKKLEMAAPRP